MWYQHISASYEYKSKLFQVPFLAVADMIANYDCTLFSSVAFINRRKI